MIEIDRDVLVKVLDTAVGSLDFGSGFLDHEEVEALRTAATLLGVDPMLATPSNFRASYAHAFTDPQGRVQWEPPWRDTVTAGKITREYNPDRKIIREYLVCGVCSKEDDHPVHHGGQCSGADMTDEEWTEGTETTCDRCGNVRICIRSGDPYIEEIYPERGPQPQGWWCRSCYRNRSDDI